MSDGVDATDGGGLAHDTCRRMVRAIDDRWELRDVTVADTGFNDVYFVTVETDERTRGERTQGEKTRDEGTRDQGARDKQIRECVLKVSSDTAEQIRAEARLHELIADATAVPVPAVLGRVDSHPEIPAPYFLMERLRGEQPAESPGSIPDENLDALARQVGRHLGDLHSIDVFDRFGLIRAPRDVESAGGARALAREHDLTVTGPDGSWADWLRELASWYLDDHAETRFSDRTADIREAVETRTDGLDGSHEPVVGRVDHALENLLVEPGTATVTGLVDWGMLRTVAPTYDLACAELTFAGLAPLDSERRERVRAALYDGYETHRTIDISPDHRRLCLLVHFLARQTWFSDWVPPEDADDIEGFYREFLDDLLSA